MYKVVLLRHGESQWNKENRFTGWTDVPLSEKGVDEARASGRQMLADGYVFDIAFTSVLKRAIKTLWLALEEMDQMFAQPPLDGDKDGMLDAWEITHFGATNAVKGGAADDWDLDGSNNLAEHTTGTDPTQPLDVFRAQVSSGAGELFRVFFSAVAGTFYELEYSDDLAPGSWTPLIRNHTGTGLQELIDPSPADTRFYRISARPAAP